MALKESLEALPSTARAVYLVEVPGTPERSNDVLYSQYVRAHLKISNINPMKQTEHAPKVVWSEDIKYEWISTT